MDHLRSAHRSGHRQTSSGIRRSRACSHQGATGTRRRFCRCRRPLKYVEAGLEPGLFVFAITGVPAPRSLGENNLANELTTTLTAAPAQEAPHLRRVLGQRDLVLLIVVAIVNLNVVPTIAANGGVTVWLWILALLLFFWPQGIAVIE